MTGLVDQQGNGHLPASMRIAHLAAEVAPFSKSGGLADVAGALPRALARLGHEVHVWSPLHRSVRHALGPIFEAPPRLEWSLDLGFEPHRVAVYEHAHEGVRYFFVAHDPSFDREGPYSPGSGGSDDQVRRFALWVRASLDAMRLLSLVPDVLHAHDWHAALAPTALALDRPTDWHFERTSTVLTLHNNSYHGHVTPEDYRCLALPADRWSTLTDSHGGNASLLRAGIRTADLVTAVSPTFAHECATPEGGAGLDIDLKKRGDPIRGILNGLDTAVWNPATDNALARNYDATSLDRKAACRAALLTEAGMDPHDSGWVVGCVSRLVWQKGLDLLAEVTPRLVDAGGRIIVLGTGEPELEHRWRQLEARHPGRVTVWIGFDEAKAHRIQAGLDAFVMPSRFEPCGLTQLCALAYGTVPIVRRVGGLADTVVDAADPTAARPNGFVFDDPTADALWGALQRARQTYLEPTRWSTIQQNGMRAERGWAAAARKYVEAYVSSRVERRSGGRTPLELAGP